MTQLFETDPWHLQIKDYKATMLPKLGKLFATGNGYLGRNGAFQESNQAGNYVTDLYGVTEAEPGYTSVEVPNYGGLEIKVNQVALDLTSQDIDDFSWDLDLHNGVLTRQFDWIQEETVLRFTFQSFLSQTLANLAAFSVQIEVLAGQGTIEIMPKIEGNLQGQPLFELQDKGQQDETLYVHGQVPSTGLAFYQGLYANLSADSKFTETLETGDAFVGQCYQGQLRADEKLKLTRVVSVNSGVASEEVEVQKIGMNALKNGIEIGFEGLLEQQNQSWQDFWQDHDVEIEGDTTAQQALRYNIAQLWMRRPRDTSRWTGNGLTSTVQGGVNAWYGDYFASSAFAGLTGPTYSKRFMMHLVEQLPEARQKAADLGLQGAFYPLTTVADQVYPKAFPITAESIYTNALVTHELYTYMNYTHDQAFMNEFGAEILRDLGQFWLSRADYLPNQELFTFLSVTGPNQYELNVNHNWFTNQMAAWSLNYIVTTLQKLSPEVQNTLHYTTKDLQRWADLRDHLYLPGANKDGIFPQSASYRDKLLADPNQLLPNRDITPDHYLRLSYVQQPDVLLGLWLLEDRFKKEIRQANFDYYTSLTQTTEPVTENIHALLAARLDIQKTIDTFKTNLNLSMDPMAITTSGLCMDRMTTNWLVFVHGLAGIRVDKGQLSLTPTCPKDWDRYSFHFYFQGRQLQITVTPEVNEVRLLTGDPLTIQLDGHGLIIE